MSERHHTSEAIYHPIPQAPVASNSIPSSDPDVDLDDEAVLSGSAILPPLPDLVDSKIRWTHFMLGCAVLLPWNALMNATPYFHSRVAESSIKNSFSSYMAVTFTVSNFVALARATTTAKEASNPRRVLVSLGALTLFSLLLTISTYTHPSPGIFFAFVLLNGSGQAIAGSYLQTAVVADAALFGPLAMQAVMSGQAAVAVAISTVQLLSSLASVHSTKPEAVIAVVSSEPEERSAFTFFALSTIFLVVCAGVHTWLISLPAYKRVVSQTSTSIRPDSSEGTGLLEESDPSFTEPRRPGNTDHKKQIVRVAKSNAIFNVAVAYVFVVTLSVFPPITVSVASTNPSVHPLIFTAIHFLMFNLGDFSGRILCSIPKLHVWSARRLLTLSLLRTIFIPLFLMCNVQWSSMPSISTGPIISSDILFMLIMLLFGLSNGYVSSMCMMAAPSLAHNRRLKGRAEDVDVAATVASFCLVGGLAVGSMVSFGVRATMCACNPFA